MSSLSAGSTGSEMIFVELIQALSKSEDRLRVLADFIHRFPDREAEIRELASFNSALDDSPAVAPPPPLPAQLGEFRIGRLIKIGGMGEIYEAYHERLDRRVALKIVRRGWTTSFARERFAREQYVLANLHHSNIVPIQTGGEDGPIQYFTMPFIQGSALNYVVDAVARLSSSGSVGRTPSVPEIVGQVLQSSEAKLANVNPLSSQRSTQLSQGDNEIPTKPSERLKLSRSYYASVARTMTDVADAIEYAHRAGVLHRDLKPANVMIESNGHCWVIDFGLAARLVTTEGYTNHSRAGETLFGNLTSELGGGTYNYMAPERWQGKPADERSDVFSLGAMLYELLALRQAYSGTISAQIKNKILQGIRVPIENFVKYLPTDLAAIADKAMHVEPALRYQSAAEFADDIRRWLRFEPVVARPAMPWKRFWLWARRQPAMAVALTIVLFASIFIFGAIVDSYKNQAVIAKAASRLSTAQRQRDKLHQALLGEHTIGWSDSAWDSVRKLVKNDASGELKSLAAATREGIDAKTINQWVYPASRLAYNPTATKLLMVKFVSESITQATNQPPLRQAQMWDSVTHQLRELPQTAHDRVGPVVFPSDDEPLQLVWNKKDPSAIVLWNMVKQMASGRMDFPFPLTEAPLSWSIIPDGSIASALIKHADRRQIMVWETATGQVLANLDTNASVIELSPDGKLIATACPNGLTEVWTIGSREKIASFSESHTDVLCFAWTKDRMQSIHSEEPGWLLATGAFGGDLTIWDVARQTARSHCIGSSFEIFSLAFSPDGMTLASAGRTHPMLWNVANGKLLLRLGHDNTMNAIVFSSQGEKLAVGSQAIWGSPGQTTEYTIQELRGQQVLRGLRSRVSQVLLSDNHRYVAALTDNWQLAVWDLPAHHLLHVFQVPIGVYAQSSGLALDDVGGRVAIAAGTEARIWDIKSGAVLMSVPLPEGFLDSLVFQDAHTLLSARQESVRADFPPMGINVDPDTTPRECRIRNLLSTEPEKPILTIPDFKRTAVSITLTPSGKQVLIEGYYEGGDVPKHRLIRLFNLPDGSKSWEMLTDSRGAQSSRIGSIDPLGHVILMGQASNYGLPILVDLKSGIQIGDLDRAPKTVGPDAALAILAVSDPEIPGRAVFSIFEIQKQRELIRLGLLMPMSDGIATSKDQHFFAYGCSDGSVVVADLWDLNRKLTEIGLH